MGEKVVDVLTTIAGFLVLLAVFAGYVWYAARRDRKWPAVAAALGLDHAPRNDEALAAYDGFRAVAAGASHSLVQVLTGTRSGVAVWLGSYRYTAKPVGSVEPFGFTLCLLQDDRLDLPHFFLASRKRPRRTNRAPLVISSEDPLREIEIPPDSPFARGYRVAAASPDRVPGLLTCSLHERLAALADPYVELEGRGSRVLVDTRTWVDPEGSAERLERALAIVDELRRAQPWEQRHRG